MEKLLVDIFAGLDERGVNYALQRGFEDLSKSSRNREVDLLVAPAHLPLLAGVLAEKGFTEIPPWGHAPHHFFVTYHANSDTWLKLDVVTDLRHGKSSRHLRVDIVDHCLRYRLRRDVTYVPASEDEFIMLLVHCLINKGCFQPAKKQRLRELRRGFEVHKTGARAAEQVNRHLAPAITWDEIVRAIDAEDWESVVKRRPRLVRQLFWRDPLKTSWRYLSQRLKRRLRPVLFAFRRRGLTIALLAPDGAGKTTLARELTREPFLQARLIYMGTNVEASTVGLPTTKWLEKRLHSPNGHKKVRLVLKALSFSNRLAEQWLRYGIALYHKWRGRFVIFDRYIYDAWVNSPARSFRQRLRKWLFELGCPTPDLVLLLDAPADLLYRRKGEHTPELLERQRRGYLSLYDQIPQMFVVDATREADEVRRTVVSMICDRHRVRAAKKERNGHKDTAAH
jgi:thymidylate kinase